jgi:hypothetical protein
MEDIFQLLSESDIVNDYEILSLLQDEDFYYLRIKSNVVGGSVPHIKIYLSDQEYNYSFQWQKENGELITRWDNAPHHQEIRTFASGGQHAPHAPLFAFPPVFDRDYSKTARGNSLFSKIKSRSHTPPQFSPTPININ